MKCGFQAQQSTTLGSVRWLQVQSSSDLVSYNMLLYCISYKFFFKKIISLLVLVWESWSFNCRLPNSSFLLNIYCLLNRHAFRLTSLKWETMPTNLLCFIVKFSGLPLVISWGSCLGSRSSTCEFQILHLQFTFGFLSTIQELFFFFF